MAKFYSISLHGDFANVLYLEKKKSILHVLEEEVIDIHKLSSFLDNKHFFYIVIDAEEAIDDVITIPSILKNDVSIKSFIIKRFKDTLSSKQLLQNYHKISEDKEESTTTYKVDAVYEKEYIKKLELVKDWQEIKSATVDKFALLNLTRKCFDGVKGYGYFSVYTHGNIINVLAIDEQNNLLFERTSTSMAGVDNSQYMNIVEEINQTIAYVKQQFRGVDFSTLVIGGSLSLDDQAAEHLLFSTNLAIAVMYPNSFVKGLTGEEPQHFILTLGAFFVKRKERFLPDKVYSLKEYRLAVNSLLFFAILSFLVTSVLAFEQYSNYSDMLDQYESTKNRLVRLVRNTDTYSIKELEKNYKHLEIAEKVLRYHPVNDLLAFKSIINLLSPTAYDFDNTNSLSSVIYFQKQFTSLSELYNFEKLFEQEYETISKNISLKQTFHTDYKKMLFKVEIAHAEKKKPKVMTRRRRR